VMHQGECWDYLLHLNAEPKRVSAGYLCDLCPLESCSIFPNRPALRPITYSNRFSNG
jgi:hypothetical protein